MPNTSVAKQPGRRTRVRLKRFNSDFSKPYLPDGDQRRWWDRLKAALGTTSSDFVNATLAQIQNASRMPSGGSSPKARAAVRSVFVDLRGVLRRSVRFEHQPKPAKEPKKATGQIEMLLPISGKKLAKEVTAK